MKSILRKSNFGFTKWGGALIAALMTFATTGWGQTYYDMSLGNYNQTFTGINGNWPANWNTVAVLSTGSIPAATKTTLSTTAPANIGSSTAIGQDATASTKLIFLGTGTTDNTASIACDLNLNFTGRTAGNLSFDAAEINNSIGDRVSTLKVYYSIDGTNWTEITGTNLPFAAANNVAKSASINVALPASLNNQSTVKLRFYYYNGSGGTTGSRPKISIDNVAVASTVAANATPPSLTAANSPTVDASFDVTFTEDSAWRSAISSITVGGSALPTTAYTKTVASKITFTPSQSTLLQSVGSKTIVVKASGYSDATVTQPISAGAATQMAVTTQPTAPSFNGGTLATQPVVTLRDLYGNRSASTANVTVTQGGGGAWALGGGLTVAAIDGVATFNGLTAGHTVALTGATLSFSSGSLAPVSSSPFNIPAPVAPTLTAASPATVDGPFIITFTDNSAWRSAITAVKVASTTLDSSVYVVSEGQITLTPSASALLQTSGEKSISVTSSGYAATTVTQTLGAGVATKLVLTTQPVAPATNGGALATQPIVKFADQYNNLTASGTGDVTAAVGTGSYTLGGNPTISPSAGVAAFTDLTAGAATALSGVTISFSSGSLNSVTSSEFNIPAPAAPTLAAAVSATVDADFVVIYPSNSNWQNVVTGVTVGGQALDGAAFFVADGQITFKPSASTLLQGASSKTIAVIATGYTDASVTQALGAGVATKLAITTQPTAPATNGGVLAVQPVVRFQDQYNNNTSGTADVTATAGNGGTWTLGGVTTVTPASDIATFSGLTAANSASALTGVAIEFSATGVQSVVSSTFDIPPPPPVNDLAENATTLPLDGTAVSGTMVQATVSAPFAGATGTSINVRDVWYKFTPTSSGSIFIQANSTSSTLDLFVWADSIPIATAGSLTPVGGSAVASTTVKKTTIFVEASKTYFLRLALNSAVNTAQAFTLSATPNYSPRLLAWDFFGEGTVSTVVTSDADAIDPNLDSSPALSRGSGAAWSTAANSFRSQEFKNNGIGTANTDYFQFQVSAASGRKLSLQNLVIKVNGTATFMNSPGVEMQFAYSLDGTTFNLIGSPVSTMDTGAPAIDLSSISALQNVPGSTTVTFRYYASGQTTTGGWGFNSPVAGQYGLYVTGTTSATNSAPSVTSSGVASAAESQTAVQTVTGTDPDAGTTLSYRISGGADSAKFVINSSTGVLTFDSAPDFESPTDVGANNVYDIIVEVSDGTLTATKAVAVTVTNVTDSPAEYKADWLAANGLPDNSDWNSDPNNVGYSLATAYAFGLDPKVRSGSPITLVSSPTGSVKVVYLRRDISSGVTYAVKTGTDLAIGLNGNDAIINESASQPSPAITGYTRYEATYTPSAPATKGFVKVQAIVP